MFLQTTSYRQREAALVNRYKQIEANGEALDGQNSQAGGAPTKARLLDRTVALRVKKFYGLILHPVI